MSAHPPLDDYLRAVERSADAARIFNCAMRTFCKLADRIGDDDRAYRVAGVALADARMLAAYRAQREARERLGRYIRTLPNLLDRIALGGAAICASPPEPANDSRARRN